MREMRRKDRALPEDAAWEIILAGDYGVLGSVNDEYQPYVTPLNYAIVDGTLYFHCAPDGHKIDNMRASSKVSFVVVSKSEVIPDRFTTKYESAIIFGIAEEVYKEEKQLGLEALINKYSPQYQQSGLEHIKEAISATAVWKININSISGKKS